MLEYCYSRFLVKASSRPSCSLKLSSSGVVICPERSPASWGTPSYYGYGDNDLFLFPVVVSRGRCSLAAQPTSDTLLAVIGPAHPYPIQVCCCLFKVGSPASRQRPFRLGITLSSRLCIPCAFRRAGIRFLRRPTPTEELTFPYGLATDYSDLFGVILFRISEIQQGREPTLRRGPMVCELRL